MAEASLGNLYEMNKDLMKNENPLSNADIYSKIEDLVLPFITSTKNKYYMLLCRERYDFTLFNFEDRTKAQIHSSKKGLHTCLVNRGTVYSIEETEAKDAIEIWVQIDDEFFVYYFFPYDLGVLEAHVMQRM